MADSLMSVEMTGVGSDRMDTRGPFSTAANPLPERCPHCSFPDIDAVPEPYLLVRKTARPTETSDAALGDFFAEEGFVAKILPPARLDLKTFRKGAIEFDLEDADSPKVDGLLFVATDHGDAFVFDLASGVAEPPVLRYDHESNLFKPYAPDFDRCVLQWASPG